MRQGGIPGASACRTTRRAFLPWTVAALFVLLPSLGGSASAQTIDESRTLHEGEYLFVGMQGWQGLVDWVIDVNWTSTRTVDTYIMDVHQFHNLENGTAFTYDQMVSSTYGNMHYTVRAHRAGDTPFYLVMDFSSRGQTDPTTPGGNSTASVTAAGSTWLAETYSSTSTGAPGADTLSLAFFGLFIAVPAVILGAVLLRRREKSKRRAGIGAALHAGQLVDTRPPTPPPPPAPPPRPAAPVFVPAAGQAPLPMPTQARYSASCKSCGKPVKENARFCGHCGRVV